MLGFDVAQRRVHADARAVAERHAGRLQPQPLHRGRGRWNQHFVDFPSSPGCPVTWCSTTFPVAVRRKPVTSAWKISPIPSAANAPLHDGRGVASLAVERLPVALDDGHCAAQARKVYAISAPIGRRR